MRTRSFGVMVLAIGLVLPACSDEVIDPLSAGGQGGGGTGGEPEGAGGDGGAGGAIAEDRGDPATFPTECSATCDEACARIVECGSEGSSVHPMVLDECLLRCGVATSGPFWDDVSGVFRCCASQPSCDDAKHCGGWLAHPTTIEPCEALCECFEGSSSVATLAAGHDPPPGYRFAPDAVFVDPFDPGADPTPVAGVKSVARGRLRLVTLGPGEQPSTLPALRALGRVLPTFADRHGRLSAATGSIFVRAASPAALRAADEELARSGISSRRRLSFGKDLYAYTSTDAWAALDAVRDASARGVHAELDMIRLYEMRSTPNDPLFEDQWHLANIGQGASTASVDARVAEAWDVTTGDASVVIAINDDGVDLNHLDFNGKLLPELNYPADWEAQMTAGLFGGHGTSVAGVAAANGNNLYAGSGACQDCSILPHLLGPSSGGSFQVSDGEIAAGFVAQVDAGAWIISNSWGISTGNPIYDEPELQLPNLAMVVKDAFDYAESSGRGGLGTVIVFAAGNSNDVLEALGEYTTNIAVGAVNDLGLKSYYSSFGALLDVAAPSNGGPTGITTTAANGQTTSSFGGTSSACPLVSGVLGLIFSANPSLTAAQARDILTSTAAKIDPVFGQYVAGVSPFYGHGMIDAARAVRLAAGLCADAASCRAPSDECGASCGTMTTCDVCRTQADCAPGLVCQALPSLGILTCIGEKPEGMTCPVGTHEVAGYCIPGPGTCDLCAPVETCNGRDDDCDGAADEDDVCGGAAPCYFEGPGCGPGLACAGTTCTATCDDDASCGEGYVCQPLKDAYGAVTGIDGCAVDIGDGCPIGCEVIASTNDDATLAEFVTCMDGATCNEAFGCTQFLPIEM